MRINQSIYNHLSVELVPKKRNVTHKSSELRAVYNNMAKYNRSSPLFLLSLSEQKQSHMINIKEAAITLKDVFDSFANPDSDIYTNKALRSSDDSVISGAVKSSNYGDIPDTLNIKIDNLATQQINIGSYMDSQEHDFAPGDYRFSLETLDNTAHFNIHVENESNLEVQNKVASYINTRNLGVSASVISQDGESALMFASDETGAAPTDDGLFFSFISAGNTDAVEKLGLNNVHTLPSNSDFYINDTKHSSSSNHISINQAIELDFHSATDDVVSINLVPNSKNAIEQLDMFIDAYNNLVELSSVNKNPPAGTRNLYNDISGIVEKNISSLREIGLDVDEDNHLIKNMDSISENFRNGNFSSLFSDVSAFKETIDSTTRRLTLDPMAYVNKLIVTYPNTSKTTNTPYTQSLYSGLMYNNYA